jgi:ribosomal protein S15P/S13E
MTTKKIKSKITQKEFEKKVIDLAKQNLTAEKIGENLRQQGIHPKEYKKKISKILKENDLYVNPDLQNIEKKLEGIKKHYGENLQDKKAKKEKDRIFSQFRKLKKYFQK